MASSGERPGSHRLLTGRALSGVLGWLYGCVDGRSSTLVQPGVTATPSWQRPGRTIRRAFFPALPCPGMSPGQRGLAGRKSRPWYELHFVVGEGRRSLGHECRDDGCLAPLHAQEPHRLCTQVLVSPLAKGVERGEEIGALLVSRYSKRGGWSLYGTRSKIPSSTSRFNRSSSTLAATPRLSWNSPNLEIPRNASRMISHVHRSPMISSVRATEHSSCPT